LCNRQSRTATAIATPVPAGPSSAWSGPKQPR